MPDRYTSEQIIRFTSENWPQAHADAHEIAIHLYRMHDLGMARARKTLVRYNLCGGEFDILATLRRSPPPHVLTPTELQRSLLITSGGMTKLLHQLEAAGLIRRSVSEQDRRSKRVHLTAQGKTTVEEAMTLLHEKIHCWLVAGLNKAEQLQLKKLLGKAVRAMEETGATWP